MKILSSYSTEGSLAIVGAGPKALALGLRAHVFKEFGIQIPKIFIIEKNEIAAHWTGRHGFTNGQLSLGTSPEKDLGFPYEHDGSDLAQRISERLQNYSWRSYLIRKGEYAAWVDRGNPAPTHQQWGAYLKFVAEQIKESVTFVKAEVIQAIPMERSWELLLSSAPDSEIQKIQCEALMLTGPAVPKMPSCFPSEKIFNMENFWMNVAKLPKDQALKIAVVGNGETAASTLIALGKKHLPLAKIEVIAPQGSIFTRGESFLENKFYSSNSQTPWKKLSLADRRNFIRRTDIGVFSPAALRELNADYFEVIPGRVLGVKQKDGQIFAEVEYNESKELRQYDNIIFASGLNHMKLLERLMGDEGLKTMSTQLGGEIERSFLEERIAEDLSVIGMTPKLFLPMLAGLAQGPGYANLSCLGSLAARVLDSFISVQKNTNAKGQIQTKEGSHETRYSLHTA